MEFWCIDVVRRKLMLVTLRTWQVKEIIYYYFIIYSAVPFLQCINNGKETCLNLSALFEVKIAGQGKLICWLFHAFCLGIIKGMTFGWFYKTLVSDKLFLFTCIIYILYIFFQNCMTKAYSVLSNLNSRREYDKEIGVYFTMRSVKKKEAGEKMLWLHRWNVRDWHEWDKRGKS